MNEVNGIDMQYWNDRVDMVIDCNEHIDVYEFHDAPTQITINFTLAEARALADNINAAVANAASHMRNDELDGAKTTISEQKVEIDLLRISVAQLKASYEAASERYEAVAQSKSPFKGIFNPDGKEK